jgi:hypothetical protein
VTSLERDCALLSVYAKSGWRWHAGPNATGFSATFFTLANDEEPRTIEHHSYSGLHAELVRLISERLT